MGKQKRLMPKLHCEPTGLQAANLRHRAQERSLNSASTKATPGTLKRCVTQSDRISAPQPPSTSCNISNFGSDWLGGFCRANLGSSDFVGGCCGSNLGSNVGSEIWGGVVAANVGSLNFGSDSLGGFVVAKNGSNFGSDFGSDFGLSCGVKLGRSCGHGRL